jgi:hypothetical protein
MRLPEKVISWLLMIAIAAAVSTVALGCTRRVDNEQEAEAIAIKFVCDPTRVRILGYDPTRLPKAEISYSLGSRIGSARYTIWYRDTVQNIELFLNVFEADGRVTFSHHHYHR